jgi:hypothetical protein
VVMAQGKLEALVPLAWNCAQAWQHAGELAGESVCSGAADMVPAGRSPDDLHWSR